MEESIKQAFHYNVKNTKLGKIEASKDQANALKQCNLIKNFCKETLCVTNSKLQAQILIQTKSFACVDPGE